MLLYRLSEVRLYLSCSYPPPQAFVTNQYRSHTAHSSLVGDPIPPQQPPYRFKPGAIAFSETRRYLQSTDRLLLPNLPLARLVHKICQYLAYLPLARLAHKICQYLACRPLLELDPAGSVTPSRPCRKTAKRGLYVCVKTRTGA